LRRPAFEAEGKREHYFASRRCGVVNPAQKNQARAAAPRQRDRVIAAVQEIEIAAIPPAMQARLTMHRLLSNAGRVIVASVIPRVPNKPPGNRNLR
jgi:hypothetical protein